MDKRNISEIGYKLIEELPPGTLIKVTWIEDEDYFNGTEWGTKTRFLEPSDNIVMLISWYPEMSIVPGYISFDCLWKDKVYNSSTHSFIEIIKT